MAEHIDINRLRAQLRATQDPIDDPFGVLRKIACLQNNGHPCANEMVLRALERRAEFKDVSGGLDAIVRAAGLYPYVSPSSGSTSELIDYEFHRPSNMADTFVLHRAQFEVYFRLIAGENVILSAPTSFGKSLIIDSIVASGLHDNIAVIVPTLALIDETRKRLSSFKNYKIITHPSQKPSTRNIYVLTQERALSFGENFPRVSFFVIDEFYKLNEKSDDENRRMVLLNQVFYRLLQQEAQFYLLGPSIHQITENAESAFQCRFLYRPFETVACNEVPVEKRGAKLDRLLSLLGNLDEPTLIYCAKPKTAGEVARAMLAANLGYDNPAMKRFAGWIGSNFHRDWTLARSVLRGIGLHHGRLPRALAQQLVREFNEGNLRFLICTSTLIEGVNTRAKNVVIYDHFIGQSKNSIDLFTFNNIKGRSGRMFQYFVGNVYLFEEAPVDNLPRVEFPLLTQTSDVPSSLLIQIDRASLRPEAQSRVAELERQDVLPLSVLREAIGIQPEFLIALGHEIRSKLPHIAAHLSWTGHPSQNQLYFASDLIWRHLVRRPGHGARSGKELAYKIARLSQRKSIKKLVLDELNNKDPAFRAGSVDEAVENVLEFQRYWATFRFPNYLRALDVVQKFVLGQAGFRSGTYGTYASLLECLFRNPVLLVLEEYGLPLSLGEKLERELATEDDLDLALQRIRDMDVKQKELRLTVFERRLVEEVRKTL